MVDRIAKVVLSVGITRLLWICHGEFAFGFPIQKDISTNSQDPIDLRSTRLCWEAQPEQPLLNHWTSHDCIWFQKICNPGLFCLCNLIPFFLLLLTLFFLNFLLSFFLDTFLLLFFGFFLFFLVLLLLALLVFLVLFIFLFLRFFLVLSCW